MEEDMMTGGDAVEMGAGYVMEHVKDALVSQDIVSKVIISYHLSNIKRNLRLFLCPLEIWTGMFIQHSH